MDIACHTAIKHSFFCCILAVSGTSNLATDEIDVARQQQVRCYDDARNRDDDDDDDVTVARGDGDRCPGDGTSLNDVQSHELDSFSRCKLVL